MKLSGCNCCNERGGGPCPGLSAPFTILEWTGSRTIDTDLRSLPLWVARKLNRYHKNNLLWQVVVRGTGDIPEGTPFCYQQAGHAPQVWTAPQTSRNERQQLAAVGTITAGSYRLRRGSDAPTKPIAWDADAVAIQTALEALDGIAAGDILVSGGPLPATPIVIEFTGRFSGHNQSELTVNNTALIGGSLQLTTLQDGHTPHDFQNFFLLPLNVGTTWQGYLRNGYGDHLRRGLHVEPSQQFWSPEINSVFRIFFFDGSTTADTGDLSVLINAAGLQSALESLPNIGSGNVSVTVGLGGGCEFDMQCGFVIEFLGALANTDFTHGLSVTPGDVFEPFTIQVGDATHNHKEIVRLNQVCETCLVDGPNVTAEWINGRIVVTAAEPLAFALQVRCLGCYYAAEFELWEYYEEREIVCSIVEGGRQVWTRMKRWGIDGFDGHLRNEAFRIGGVTTPRFPPCDAEIVYLGDGSFENIVHPRSNDFPEARYTINPTGAVQRLKDLFGTKFSYWGGWIKETVSGEIVTRFDEYDLSRASVLFLGGLNATADVYLTNQFAWDVLPFQAGTLQPLIDWLDLGGKLLVLDGGYFPESLLSALGLTTVVHPEGEPLGTDTLISDSQIGPATPPDFDFAHVAAQTHPFTTDVSDLFLPSQEASLGGSSASLDGRIYTSSIRCLTAGGSATVIGQLLGSFVQGVTGIPYVVKDFNYPAVVVEPWAAAPTSRVVISYVNDAIAGCDLGNQATPPVGIDDCPRFLNGHGLSHRVAAQFLRNLWDRRNEF